jgi:TolB-like protein/Tfp pilus assembly protein PilF
VAVLPFDHWGDESQSYISDGIAEEIMNSLTRVKGLRVAARGSAFSFRDRKEDIAGIRDALNVHHIVDGSVQRVGDRIKVTAYLIDANDGSTLWSDAREAAFDDVFDVQQRMALAVFKALNEEIGLASGLVVDYRPSDPRAYDDFLLGKHLWRQRGEVRIQSAIALFESAVERDPRFGRAWSALAMAYITLPSYRRNAPGAHEKAYQIARRALEVDPELGEPYSVLAVIYANRGELIEAGRYHRLALARRPNDPDIMSMYEEFAADMGHTEESRRQSMRGYEIDPVRMRSNMGAGWALTATGKLEEGLMHFERAWSTSQIEPVWQGKFMNLVEQERYKEAESWLANHPSPNRVAANVAFLRGYQDEKFRVSAADEIITETLEGRLGTIFAAAMLGSLEAADATYDLIDQLEEQGRQLDLRGIWWHSNLASRQDSRLVEVARRRGMLDYWTEFGPPDGCSLDREELVCYR